MLFTKSFNVLLLAGLVSNLSHFTQAALKTQTNSSIICKQRQLHISNDKSPAVGFICAIVAVLMFGSNFVPVKKIPTGDGIFFQWILCLGIWFVGVIVHLSATEMKFYPLAMVGGAIWCTGNIFVVPIIKTIGLAMGLLIWCVVNLLSGWATGRFGTFGLICEQPVAKSALNYVGVLLALISLVIFVFIKTEPTPSYATLDSAVNDTSENNVRSSTHKELNEDERSYLLDNVNEDEDLSWCENLSASQKRFIGISLSIVSGFFYGISFVPMYIIQKRDESAPSKGLEYVFSQFCGILMTSTVYFLIYCIYKRNKPNVYSTAIAPGFVSGILWAIGDVGWFVANTKLSEPVSFPIVTTGPGVIAAVWGIILFKEIKGIRNFMILGVAFSFQLTGAVITGFSK